MSIAERIAKRFSNDGTQFQDRQGYSLQFVAGKEAKFAECKQTGQTWIASPELAKGETVRYEFRDGSAIVIDSYAWDIEGSKPFIWKSAE